MTTPEELGLVTPDGQDWTRDGDNAITTNAQVLAEVYDELKALDTWRGAVPNGTNLDHMAGRTWRGDWGVGEDSTGTQISSLLNLPEVVQGVLTVKTTNTGFSIQIYEPYNRAYFYRRAAKNLSASPSETLWNNWEVMPREARPLPNGTNLDHVAGRTWRGDWGVGEDSTGTQISSLVNLPEVVQGVLTVKTTNTGFSIQIYEPYNRAYFYRRAAKTLKANPAETTWHPWDKFSAITGSGNGSYVKNRILEQEMRRFYGVPELGAAVPVTVIFDHGTNVFKSDILPALTANNLQATLALNSDMYNPSDPRYSHNTNTTWSEIDAWPVEKSNHGRTHGNQTTFADLEYEIVGGLEELQANLPNSKIYTWTQTGQGAGAWMGFENGATADSWDASPAGRLILDNHAVSTGAVMTSKPALYDMNGQVKQGVWGYWLDTPAGIATAKTRIAEAVAQRKGIVLRCHPEVLGNTGNSTAAEVVAFLQWLGAEQSAQRVKTLNFSQWSISRVDRIYSTAWKNLAPINGWLGDIQVRRDGRKVSFRVRNLSGAAATGTSFVQLPTGYKTAITDVAIQAGNSTYRLGVNASAQAFLPTNFVTSTYWSEVSFSTDDPMPAP